MRFLIIVVTILCIPLIFVVGGCLFFAVEHIVHKIHMKIKKYESTRVYQCIRNGIKKYFLFDFDDENK